MLHVFVFHSSEEFFAIFAVTHWELVQEWFGALVTNGYKATSVKS